MSNIIKCKDFYGDKFYLDMVNRQIIICPDDETEILYQLVFWPPVLKLTLTEIGSNKIRPTHCIPLYIESIDKYGRKFDAKHKILLTEDEAAEIEYDIKQYQNEWLDKNRELIEN